MPLRPGQLIGLCVFALLTIGVVMVNSADMQVAKLNAPPESVRAVTAETIILSRSTMYMGLAIAAMIVGYFLPVRRIAAGLVGAFDGAPSGRVLTLLLIGGAAMIALCAAVYLQEATNGAYRWIKYKNGGMELSMQPSELAKWGIIFLLAWYCAVRARVMHEFWRGMVPALLLIGAVSGFILLEDLGTGVLIAGVCFIVLLAGGARLWYFVAFTPLALLAVVGAIITSPYRVRRIMAFLDPYADPQGIGFHTIQSLIAVANGQGFGRGLGHGLQKFGYLPEDRTDFLFAIICEELGIAGATVVVGLFLLLIWSGYAVLRREENTMLRLVALGVMATVGLQACFNLAVVTGMAPTKGIALPLLSSGGTGWILTAFSLGLVMAIGRTQQPEPIPDPTGDLMRSPGANAPSAQASS